MVGEEAEAELRRRRLPAAGDGFRVEKSKPLTARALRPFGFG